MAAVNLQRNTKSIGLNKQQRLCCADTHCVGLCQLRPPGPYCAFPHRAGPTITQQTFPAVLLLLCFLNNEGLAVAAFINVSFTSYSSNANLSSFNFCPSRAHTNTLSESASCPWCSCQIVQTEGEEGGGVVEECEVTRGWRNERRASSRWRRHTVGGLSARRKALRLGAGAGKAWRGGRYFGGCFPFRICGLEEIIFVRGKQLWGLSEWSGGTMRLTRALSLSVGDTVWNKFQGRGLALHRKYPSERSCTDWEILFCLFSLCGFYCSFLNK